MQFIITDRLQLMVMVFLEARYCPILAKLWMLYQKYSNKARPTDLCCHHPGLLDDSSYRKLLQPLYFVLPVLILVGLMWTRRALPVTASWELEIG